MLNYQRSKLLNLALQMEIALNDMIGSANNDNSWQQATKEQEKLELIIYRNIQSIKKTIKRL